MHYGSDNVIPLMQPVPPITKPLYATAQEAHDDLMRIAGSVVVEMKLAGKPIPSAARFDRDTRELWNEVWRHLAPPAR